MCFSLGQALSCNWGQFNTIERERMVKRLIEFKEGLSLYIQMREWQHIISLVYFLKDIQKQANLTSYICETK